MIQYPKRLFIIAAAAMLAGIYTHAEVSEKKETVWMAESRFGRRGKGSVTRMITAATRAKKAKKFKKALRLFEKIEQKSVNLGNQGKALVEQGDCLVGMDDHWSAYQRYRRACEGYSNFISLNNTLEKEFEIATRFFQDGRRRILIFHVSADGKAIDIFDHIVQAAPFSIIAIQSLYHSALISYRGKEYDDAVAKYNQFLKQYPNARISPVVMVALARALLEGAKDADGDGTMVRRALAELEIFLKRYPNHPRRPVALELMKDAQRLERQRLLFLAEFYLRESHYRPGASQRYLDNIILKYPESKSAVKARILLAKLNREDETETAPKKETKTNGGTPDAEPKRQDPVTPKAKIESSAPTPGAKGTAEREKAKAVPDTAPKTAPPARDKASGKYLLPLDINDD